VREIQVDRKTNRQKFR